ncbi:unnamed protein product [Pleuronectes platessa]|uniref:Uncharacterized protein n=1 Tax=Pleuronectes platessa TaxID=8262 RepID=A0A9N7VAV4_PLEPL|nr:unnamed protein product [Pleuronectes platessa]
MESRRQPEILWTVAVLIATDRDINVLTHRPSGESPLASKRTKQHPGPDQASGRPMRGSRKKNEKREQCVTPPTDSARKETREEPIHGEEARLWIKCNRSLVGRELPVAARQVIHDSSPPESHSSLHLVVRTRL